MPQEPDGTARRRFAFLDRDGTINVEVEGALKDPEQLRLLPGAADAIRRLNGAGFVVVCVTNQSAIGRGWMTEEDYQRVRAGLERLLAAEGARLDASYHAPHHPTEGIGAYRRESRDRKPAPGMFERAFADLDGQCEEPAARESWVVGDAGRDLEAGAQVGAHPILVATGKGRREYARLAARDAAPETYLPDLAAAVEWILATSASADASSARRAPQGR